MFKTAGRHCSFCSFCKQHFYLQCIRVTVITLSQFQSDLIKRLPLCYGYGDVYLVCHCNCSQILAVLVCINRISWEQWFRNTVPVKIGVTQLITSFWHNFFQRFYFTSKINLIVFLMRFVFVRCWQTFLVHLN